MDIRPKETVRNSIYQTSWESAVRVFQAQAASSAGMEYWRTGKHDYLRGNKMEKLTDREVDVMMAIWNSTYEAVPTGEILRHINRAKRNSLQTLQVVLRRLCEKGVIQCEKGRQTNLYRPLIKEEDYLEFASQNFVEHHYHSSPRNLVFAFLRHRRLNKRELNELRDYLDDLKEEDDDIDDD